MNTKTVYSGFRLAAILSVVMLSAVSSRAYAQQMIIGTCSYCSDQNGFDQYAYERMVYEYGYWGGPDTVLLVRAAGLAETAAYAVTWSGFEWPGYGWYYEPVLTQLTLSPLQRLLLDQNTSGRAYLMKSHIDEMPETTIPAGNGLPTSAMQGVDTDVLTELYLQGNPQFSMQNIAGSMALSQVADASVSFWNQILSVFMPSYGDLLGFYVKVNYQDGSYAVYFMTGAITNMTSSLVYKVSADGENVIIYDHDRVKNIEGDPNLAANSTVEGSGQGTIEPIVVVNVGHWSSNWYEVVMCYTQFDCIEGRKFRVLIEGGM